MKLLTVVLLSVLAVNSALAQQGATINLQNNSTSLVYNATTGALISNSDRIHVLLYVAPAGVTNEAAFIPVFPTTLISPAAGGASAAGRYSGGYRTVPNFMPGDVASFQVRAFETNYGNTYEAAVAAGPINGRPAMVGKSGIAQIMLAGGIMIIRDTSVCGSFSVGPSGGSYVTAHDLVVSEGSNGVAYANFKITLLSTQAVAVQIDFATADGTAIAGSDYVATNGFIIFAPGETVKTVAVALTPDAPAEPDEEFYLDLGNAINGVLARNRLRCVITEIRITGISVDTAISFNTVGNRRYTVERSTDFVTWQPVAGATNILGTGGIVTAIDRGNGCAAAVLYRATVLEQ